MENKVGNKTSYLKQKVGFLEKFSYAQLDFAGQLVAQVVNAYLLYFFTDVALIPTAIAGTILLIARVVDAVAAPVWGTLIDMTDSKWGKARPYFLWLAFPYAAAGVLLFWAPALSMTGKIWYCGIVYIIYGILYLGINAPITTMLPLLTSNPDERITLNSWRLVGSNLGSFMVNLLVLPLVAFFGSGNDVKGFRIFIVIFAIFNCALTIFSFSNVRERVKVASSKRVTLKQSVRAMNKNWPWFILVAGNLLFWIAQQNRQSGMVYYFTYYFHNKGLVTFFNSISLIQVLAILLIPLMNKHMTKSHIWALGFAGAVFGQVIIMVSGHSMAGAIAGWVIGMLGSGIAVSMPFAMLGSAVDFGEWKSGINAAGLLTTIGSAFCMSMGQGIAGYINGAFLSAFGYVANATQTAHALTGISLDFNGATIVIYALAIIPALMYGKYEKMEDKIITDLSKTRL